MPNNTLRVHVENDREVEPALHVTRERFTAALAKRPDLQARLSVTCNDDPDKFAEVAADAEVLFAARVPQTLAFAPSLKWVQSTLAGVDRLLPVVPAGAVLTNASGVHREKGGEFILTAVLMLNYGIPRFATDKVNRTWAPRYGGTVAGKTAMLLGVGGIGGEGARLLKSFGVRTIGVSRSGRVRDHVDQPATFADVERLLPETDFLVSSLPHTPATVGLVDRSRLDLLPHHAGIVNVGRPRVFDCQALIAKLSDGTLAGAVLDVFPEEPAPADSAFWGTPNLVMTPHCSVDDHSVYIERCVAIFLDNLQRYLAGAPLLNVVDRDQGY